jgi:ParB family chromosome partitioning protein
MAEKNVKDTGISNVRVAIVKNNRAQSLWVDINSVVPNPLNPRKDDSVKTDELQNIIRSKGWETPLTAYKKGNMYVLLSGHRRLYAARKFGAKEIPIFVVDAPKTHQEEVERIASAQLAQENWTALEWGRFTYERWLAWGRPGMKKFSKEIGLAERTVESYVKVLDYFPLHEIEAGLNQKLYSLSFLLDVVLWIKKLKELKPSFVEDLTEEMIRRIMLDKITNRKVSKEGLRKKYFLEKVKDQDLKRFLLDKDMHIEDLMTEYEFDVKEKSFHGQLVSMGYARKSVKNLNPKNKEEAKKAFDALSEMKNSMEAQLQFLERKYPDVVEKEDLFTWGKK